MECFIMAGQPQYCSLFSVCRADGTVTDGDPYLSLLKPPHTHTYTHTYTLKHTHTRSLSTQIGFYITEPVRYEQVIFSPPCLADSYTFASVMWARLRSFSVLESELWSAAGEGESFSLSQRWPWAKGRGQETQGEREAGREMLLFLGKGPQLGFDHQRPPEVFLYHHMVLVGVGDIM